MAALHLIFAIGIGLTLAAAAANLLRGHRPSTEGPVTGGAMEIGVPQGLSR